MQSRGARIGVVVAAVAVVVVLFVVLSGGDDSGSGTTSSTSTPAETGTPVQPNQKPQPTADVQKFEIEVENGEPVGGVQEISIPKDAQAEIVVSSPDTSEEVHLHGYDVMADLTPEEPAKVEFDATIEGVFEMELEDSVTQIAEVTVE
jgi:hypothetical protein